jgi:hypothetical protein
MLSFLEGARGSPAPCVCADTGEVLGLEVELEAEWPVDGVLELSVDAGNTV